jgi:hypothetical protein
LKKSTLALGSLVSCALLAGLPGLAAAQTLGTPSWTSASVAGCNGLYDVTWSAVTGATTYEIWIQVGGTVGYNLWKSTPSTETLIREPNQHIPDSYEVQACNASGCGALSGSWEGDYYAGCP